MRESLKTRLLKYLRANNGKHASGDLQRMVMEKTTYTPSNVSRRLRELQREGLAEVSYVRGHAFYSATPPKQIIPYFVNGERVSQKVIWE